MKTRGIAAIVFFLGVLMLAGTASALDPGNLTWKPIIDQTDDDWLMAGGTETAVVTVEVPESAAIKSAVFSIDGDLGTFDSPVESAGSGYTILEATFHPGTKSGSGYVNLLLTYDEGSGEVSDTFTSSETINIDHNTPFATADIDYEVDLEVNDITPITLKMVDQYGNVIDNRYETYIGGIAERVEFWCSPSACFVNEVGSCIGTKVTMPVDSVGNATANFRLSTVAGENVLWVNPIPTRPADQYLTIYGIGKSYPWDMDVIVLPASREVPIGGSTFTIVYTLYDQYGNPSPKADLTLTPDIGGTQSYTTNLDGKVTIIYGPKNTVGASTITAITENPTVTDQTVVWFVWPTDVMMFVAIPQIMPSIDVDPDIQSELIVTLVGGNVTGEQVKFEITGLDVINGTLAESPYLTDKDGNPAGAGPLIVETNNFGEAIAYLVPGEFNPGPISLAELTVQATWDGTIKTVPLEFRNDPYISVETRVVPEKTAYAPGEEIMVEIWLKGDGIPILVTLPVDVVLTMNRGDSTFGDMFYEGNQYSEDKLVWAVWGAMGFVENIQNYMSGANQMALVTYGPNGTTNLPNKLPGLDNTAVDDMDYIKNPVANSSWDMYGYNPYPFNHGHYAGYEAYYPGYDLVDILLGNYTDDMQNALRNTTPSSTSGGTDLCPMRYALYNSIEELVGSGRGNTDPQTVRAIVLLTDRQWDSGGDILAGGSWDNTTKTWSPEVMPNQANSGYDHEDPWPASGFGAWHEFEYDPGTDAMINASSPEQNMAILAKKYGIKIFVLAYPNKANNIPTSIEAALKALADSTGGGYYVATTGKQVFEDFQHIADELKVAAAINTTMSVDFVSEVDENNLNYTADDIFNYTAYVPASMPALLQPLTNESTAIRHWNWNESYPEANKNFFSGGVIRNLALNQSADFEDDQTLTFGTDLLGSLNIKETWMTQFSLEINSSITDTVIFGLFGNGTGIKIEYGETTIPIPFPQKTVMIDPGLLPDPDIDTYIDVSDLAMTEMTIEKIGLEWDLAYNGTDSMLTETVEVKDAYGGWNTIAVRDVANSTTHDTATWYIPDLPLGVYKIRVTATSDDAGYDRDEIEIDTSILARSPYIKVV